ncbi:hypothetical protein MASR1M12_24570 [Erysipelotrichia bacterium]
MRGTANAKSDLDLVIFMALEKNSGLQPRAFDESDLPFRVDLFDWANCPNFRNNIEAGHLVLTTPQTQARKDKMRQRTSPG